MLKYNEFVEKVNDAGFWTPYTNYIDQDIFRFAWGDNVDGQTYTNDPETDPKKWITRVVKEKKFAYGYFFNGKPDGYIAPRFVSVFVDAFRPRMTVEERYNAGKISAYEKKVWDLLTEHGGSLDWSDLRKLMGFAPAVQYKTEIRKLESALKNLQMTFDLVSRGGWVCDKLDNWIPSEWMEMNPRLEHEEALEIIYRQAEIITNAGDAKKAFVKSLKLYKM